MKRLSEKIMTPLKYPNVPPSQILQVLSFKLFFLSIWDQYSHITITTRLNLKFKYFIQDTKYYFLI